MPLFPKNIFKTEGFMTSQQNNNTNTIPEPNWMKEDCVQSIPKEKLQFLQKLVFESSFHPHGDPQICHTRGTAENESDRPPDGKENARKEGVKLPPSGRFQETFRGLNFSDMETFCDPSVP